MLLQGIFGGVGSLDVGGEGQGVEGCDERSEGSVARVGVGGCWWMFSGGVWGVLG